MGIGDSIWNVPNAFNNRLYNYGRQNYDRTQVFVASYISILMT